MSLKPLKKSFRLPLLNHLEGVSLERNADEILLSGAAVTSEGMVQSSAGSDHTYFGTLFVNIDLNRNDLDIAPSDPTNPGLAQVLSRSILLHSRLMRMARREVENRTTPLLPKCMSVEMQFKIEDSKLLVDIYIECPLAEPAHGLDGVEEER